MTRTKLFKSSTFWLVPSMFSAALLGGCTHSPLTQRMEPAKVASELGFSQCKVSVPLSNDQLKTLVRVITGLQTPEESSDWHHMDSVSQIGDHIRLVSCSSASHRGAPGYSFFGLFRDNKLVVQTFQVIDN